MKSRSQALCTVALLTAFSATPAGTALAQADANTGGFDADAAGDPPISSDAGESSTERPKGADVDGDSGGRDANTGGFDADSTDDPPIESLPGERDTPRTVTTETTEWIEGPDGKRKVVTTTTETTEIAAPRPLVGYDGGFFIQNAEGPDELRLGGELHTRFTYSRSGSEFSKANFQIHTARIKMKGTLLTEALTFGISVDVGRGMVTLKDYWSNYAFIEDKLALKVGSYKKPFDRQEMTSSYKRLMIDKAITNKPFGAGRDIGVMLHNSEAAPFEYALGVFNGTGIGSVLNDSGVFTNVPKKFKPQAALRLGYSEKGVKGYDANDLNLGPPRFAAGFSMLADFDVDDEHAADVTAEVDAIMKAYGLSVSGSFFVKTRQDGAAWTEQDFDGLGAYLEAGYVIEEIFQPAARFAVSSLKGGGTERESVYEASLGMNFFFFGPALKWLNQGRILFNTGENEYAGLSELQLAF